MTMVQTRLCTPEELFRVSTRTPIIEIKPLVVHPPFPLTMEQGGVITAPPDSKGFSAASWTIIILGAGVFIAVIYFDNKRRKVNKSE